jgi:hypothetical protein
MKHNDERPRVNQEDRDFADRLVAHYAPPPWTSAKRVGFDEALRARIERPQRRGILAPALATVAVAALVWVSFSLRPAGDESNPVAASVWESELFLSSDVSPLDDRDDSEGLPEDYLAIASLFLDG